MDLQSWFYVTSIIFVMSWFVFMVLVIAAGLVMFRRLKELDELVQKRLNSPLLGSMSTLLPLVPTLLSIFNVFRRRR